MEDCGFDVCNQDVDKLFSYNTRQEVNIQDKRLGCTSMCLQFTMIMYIVFGIFYYGLGYLEFEQARGAIATHVRGDAVGVSTGKPATRYFSAEEITYPGLENGNVFVTTRQTVTHQKRGSVCIDHTMPCASDADCTASVQGKCTSSRYCEEAAWCAGQEKPEIYELEVGDLSIWVKSSIQFIKLAPELIYSTEQKYPFPERGFNLFSVRDLLLMCEPVPVRYEEVSELGAAIEVQFIWNCDVSDAIDKCHPQINARRLDVMFDPDHIGYAFNYAESVSDEERVLNEMRGIRIFLRTYGTGQKVSMTIILLKLSTSLTLLGVAPIIADLVARYAFGVRRADRYIARVREDSPDFSDYMEGINKKKEEEAALPSIDEDDNILQQREVDWQRRLDEED